MFGLGQTCLWIGTYLRLDWDRPVFVFVLEAIYVWIETDMSLDWNLTTLGWPLTGFVSVGRAGE